MNWIIEIIPQLIELTRSGKIHWEHMDDSQCYTVWYNNDKFILYKTETDAGIQDISLNNIKENKIIGRFIKWGEGTPEFALVDELYVNAEQTKVLIACFNKVPVRSLQS